MIQEKNSLIQIKGIRDGLLVTLSDGKWVDLQEVLLKNIQEQSGFFKGARLALDVGNQILHAAELGGLRDKLSDYEVTLWAVISNSPLTEQTAQVLGLATKIFTPRPEKVGRLVVHHQEGDSALFLQKTLRSGTRIVHPGNVVVIGDVNPGAEIIASGNIVIWGKLRGVVHAGAEGNEKASIYALELVPMQLRIASKVAVTPQKKGKSGPEMAQIQNGQVVAMQWEAKENIR
jgi:septum site-determining protein MinC